MKSLFANFSSSQLNLVERMRGAEASLISYIGRFGATSDGQVPQVELFDTQFPKSMLQLGSSCSYYDILKPSYWKKNMDKKEESYHIHGVKVTSKEYKKRSGTSNESPLVLLHGYANGSLYFYRNLFGLCNHHFGGTVYALDLLGWGLSSRPKFLFPSQNSLTTDDKRNMSEAFFVESLEAWRKAHNIEKMTLGGHSMGGYLSVAYCEKYPQHVDRLILLSPVGIPDVGEEGRPSRKELPYTFRFGLALATRLWEAGVTPSSFVRSLPESRGHQMVASYVQNRLKSIDCPDERSNLTDYLYLNAALPGSGEDCLNKILDPMAYAKKPLVYRIPNLKIKNISFVYGQSDWMQPSGGIMTKHISEEHKKNGRTDAPDIRIFGVKGAGHLLMLENWEEFNAAVILAATDSRKKLHHAGPKPFEYSVGLESDAERFFSAPRWNKRSTQVQNESVNEKPAAA